jgi:hypothetical protein
MNATLILKGGGYAPGWRMIIGASARHHHWTGTNDLGRPSVPPPDGGLPKPSNPWIRFVRWISYYARWVKYRVALVRPTKTDGGE